MLKPILVVNCGSSSIKFSLFSSEQETPILSGLAECLGSSDALIKLVLHGEKCQFPIASADHQSALSYIIKLISEQGIDMHSLAAVGHRVVHGGEYFTQSQILDDQAIDQIEKCNSLAPLHNPANILGIRAMQAISPDVPQIAVFDTAFHQTMPSKAYLYALPYDYYRQHHVRRYGFHGTSHRFVALKAAEKLNKPLDQLSAISVHLGNGSSATAICNGRSADTTMGMTPLEGLIMGSRSGDIDPGIAQYLCQKLDIDIDEFTNILNKKSGLLGLSELSNDMRTIIDAADQGNTQAELALEVYCFRLARQIAGLSSSLTHIDALIFTGGIGENADVIRQRVVERLSLLNLKIDSAANSAIRLLKTGNISTADSVPILVIPTNEEWMIASDCHTILSTALD